MQLTNTKLQTVKELRRANIILTFLIQKNKKQKTKNTKQNKYILRFEAIALNTG